jgi:ribosome-associated toxin RatA of RatAB toxin-antitoxin module
MALQPEPAVLSIMQEPLKQPCCRYSPKQLYDVVAEVQHYKEFVPWCQRSHIIRREGDTFLEAELEVGFRLFVER